MHNVFIDVQTHYMTGCVVFLPTPPSATSLLVGGFPPIFLFYKMEEEEEQDKNIILILQENALKDFTKSNLDKFQKARMIQSYMDNKNIGVTAIGKMLGVAKSTVHGWLVYNNITQEEYNKLKAIGISDTDIFNALKSNKDVMKLTPKTAIAECNILNKTIDRIEKRVKDGDGDISLLNKLHEVRNKMNSLMTTIEKAIKG